MVVFSTCQQGQKYWTRCHERSVNRKPEVDCTTVLFPVLVVWQKYLLRIGDTTGCYKSILKPVLFAWSQEWILKHALLGTCFRVEQRRSQRRRNRALHYRTFPAKGSKEIFSAEFRRKILLLNLEGKIFRLKFSGKVFPLNAAGKFFPKFSKVISPLNLVGKISH